jgi:hypothetical protein
MFKRECRKILQQNNYVQKKEKKISSKIFSRDFKFKLKNKKWIQNQVQGLK